MVTTQRMVQNRTDVRVESQSLLKHTQVDIHKRHPVKECKLQAQMFCLLLTKAEYIYTLMPSQKGCHGYHYSREYALRCWSISDLMCTMLGWRLKLQCIAGNMWKHITLSKWDSFPTVSCNWTPVAVVRVSQHERRKSNNSESSSSNLSTEALKYASRTSAKRVGSTTFEKYGKATHFVAALPKLKLTPVLRTAAIAVLYKST